MFGFKRITVSPYERAIEFRDGRIISIAGPGVISRFFPTGRTEFLLVNVSEPEVKLANVESHLRDAIDRGEPNVLAEHIHAVDVANDQIGLVYKQDRLSGLLAPGARALYWKASLPVRVVLLPLAQAVIAPELVRTLLNAAGASILAQDIARYCMLKIIATHELGVLSIDGKFVEVLASGSYGFWKSARQVQIDVLDVRAQQSEVSGQEILTRDKLSLRVNLSASWKVSDVRQAKSDVVDFKESLYRELQFALRQAIGTRTLDELLANKQLLDGVIFAAAAPKVAGFGITLISAGVKDLILPGEMKELLNQVVHAEKAALANVIRRREETAATRSLLNTAKLMEESPILLRLKELEALEKVSEKIGSLTVFGGIDGLMKQLISLKAA
jgi:regulator of protease activity HflC (stomatin/prohibitin superfamily)